MLDNDHFCDPENMRKDFCKAICSSFVEVEDSEMFPGLPGEQRVTIVHRTARDNEELPTRKSAVTGYFALLDYVSAHWSHYIKHASDGISQLGAKEQQDFSEAKRVLDRIFLATTVTPESNRLIYANNGNQCTLNETVGQSHGTINILERIKFIRKAVETTNIDTMTGPEQVAFFSLDGKIQFKCRRQLCHKYASGFLHQTKALGKANEAGEFDVVTAYVKLSYPLTTVRNPLDRGIIRPALFTAFWADQSRIFKYLFEQEDQAVPVNIVLIETMIQRGDVSLLPQLQRQLQQIQELSPGIIETFVRLSIQYCKEEFLDSILPRLHAKYLPSPSNLTIFQTYSTQVTYKEAREVGLKVMRRQAKMYHKVAHYFAQAAYAGSGDDMRPLVRESSTNAESLCYVPTAMAQRNPIIVRALDQANFGMAEFFTDWLDGVWSHSPQSLDAIAACLGRRRLLLNEGNRACMFHLAQSLLSLPVDPAVISFRKEEGRSHMQQDLYGDTDEGLDSFSKNLLRPYMYEVWCQSIGCERRYPLDPLEKRFMEALHNSGSVDKKLLAGKMREKTQAVQADIPTARMMSQLTVDKMLEDILQDHDFMRRVTYYRPVQC
ncbi:hypothetical protein N3K66_008549 [Trichothecium roseum]|uniref:Uncharacterized protein n=1 Tax=Trichothecium roseum TaxID=47278 RepID=A0ACC0UR08_9HYPO|nr:hypothetical protein N3K66_008549 [Trichothecium roseum]